MKKFNLVLLVLVAVLFGSGFVACTNSASDFDLPENSGTGNSNNESYVTAVYDDDETVATFIPVPGCTTVSEVEAQFGNVDTAIAPLDFNWFRDSEIVKNRIRNSDLYRFNKYIIYRYDGDDVLFELDINGTDLLKAISNTNTESAR